MYGLSETGTVRKLRYMDLQGQVLLRRLGIWTVRQVLFGSLDTVYGLSETGIVRKLRYCTWTVSTVKKLRYMDCQYC